MPKRGLGIYISATGWYDEAMLNEPSIASAPLASPAVTLKRVWHVDADSSYDNHWARGRPGLIALRTLAGRGRLRVGGQSEFILQAGTLALLEAPHVQHYKCLGGRWHFWWLEFLGSGGEVGLPLNRPLEIAPAGDERPRMQLCFDMLRRGTPRSAVLASATLAGLLANWVHNWPGAAEEPGRHTAAMRRVVEAMRDHLARPLTADELAAIAGLGPRRFRQVFRQATGATPKRYYDSLRLSMAGELLRMGGHRIADVSDRLGYSSPFHFSRAFKAHHGLAPSAYLRS